MKNFNYYSITYIIVIIIVIIIIIIIIILKDYIYTKILKILTFETGICLKNFYVSATPESYSICPFGYFYSQRDRLLHH